MAKETREIISIVGRPSDDGYIAIIKTNQIEN